MRCTGRRDEARPVSLAAGNDTPPAHAGGIGGRFRLAAGDTRPVTNGAKTFDMFSRGFSTPPPPPAGRHRTRLAVGP
jgi:hypothetical protein